MAREAAPAVDQGDERAEDATIAAAIAQGNIHVLIDACDAAETRCAQRSTPYHHAAVHILGLLIVRDLVNARLMWRRLSLETREDSDVTAACTLASLLWRKDRGSFFQEASNHAWSPQCESLAARLVQRERADVLSLLGRAYSVVNVTSTAGMLGLSREETLRVCLHAGWILDPHDTEYLKQSPSGAATSAASGADSSGRPTVEQSLQALTNLTEQLVRLQTT